MNSPKKKLFLIDAMSLIYRAYFALNKNPAYNSKGLNTSAILGFANTITEILSKEKPTHIGVAFDSFAPTFRHEEFEAYKATREAMPEDISKALPYIREMLEALEIPVFAMEGFEADDIVGTLAKMAEKEGFQVYMMTTDKDFGQLVSDNIFIYKPAKFGEPAEVLGVKEVCNKYSIIKPEQLIDILGLWGDSSDNVPGVPGIGEVKARQLISEFGNIENLIEKADKIPNAKLKESIKSHSAQALLSKKLVTIATDMPLDFDVNKLEWKLPDNSRIIKLFEELEFRTFSKRFIETFYSDKPDIPIPKYGLQGSLFDETDDKPLTTSGLNSFHREKTNYILVNTKEKFKELAEILNNSKSFCFDVETTGLDPITHEIIGISFCTQPQKAYYVSVSDGEITMQDIKNLLEPIFINPKIEKIAQNLKFDYRMLLKYNIEISGPIFDTMIAHYLLYPEQKHNLDYLAETYLGYKTIAFSDIFPFKDPTPEQIKNLPAKTMADYSCEDADITLQLKHILEKELEKNSMKKLFNDIEMPLCIVLANMENNGVRINEKELELFSQELADKIAEIEKSIYNHAGQRFNIASPKQLGEILFDNLKITDKPSKTKTKQYATGEEILLKLKDKHPVVKEILEHRTLTKLKTTYVDALPKYINPKTNKIHTEFNQTVTTTGRLSSSNPNMQNIPIRTESGKKIRKAFIPSDSDHVILSADYSQIELRIIAAISEETSMIEAFIKGMDIHKATASRVYGISIDDVDSNYRRNAKTVNFGIVYGISGYGLSERLNIPKKEAEILIEEYFKQYPKIKDYMTKTIEFAKKNGYVETLMKRRRYINNINSSNSFVRGMAERMAINMPIQGSAADMIKIAMNNIYKSLTENNLKSKLVLQIHDELVFDVPKAEVEAVKTIVAENMQKAMKLALPLDIEMNTGENWLEAH